MPALVRGVERIAAARDTRIAVVAHAGDGNTHPLIVYDATVHAELSRPGQLVISYNVNSLNPEDDLADVAVYRDEDRVAGRWMRGSYSSRTHGHRLRRCAADCSQIPLGQ